MRKQYQQPNVTLLDIVAHAALMSGSGGLKTHQENAKEDIQF
jgi:hypothetical protein